MGTRIKEKVYDNVYGRKEISYESPKGVIGFFYRKFIRFEVNRYQASYELLSSSGEKLLDVGCGDGDFIFMVRNKFRECYGVDVSAQRIEKAKEKAKEFRGHEKFHFFECDVDEGLRFSDNFFDSVTCIAVLEHVFNPPNLVKEIHRVLKPGGIFLVQVPNIAWMPYRIQLMFGQLPTTGGVYLGADWEHLHNFTQQSISLLLREAGFQIKGIFCSGIFAKYRKYWLSVLGGDLIVLSTKRVNP
jgi:ubiquinone/menaquinone biosynthesis C-methylase UbiE